MSLQEQTLRAFIATFLMAQINVPKCPFHWLWSFEAKWAVTSMDPYLHSYLLVNYVTLDNLHKLQFSHMP